jgi:hypothetical protein
MNKTLNIKRNWVILGIIGIGIMTRFIPHPPNFTAIGAIALFGGAWFSKKYLAILIPLAALFISDGIFELFIPGMGFHQGMLFVYFSFVIISLLGIGLRQRKNVWTIAGASVLSSVLFFLISNFGSWLIFYPQSMEGLSACYIAAIPFFHHTLMGDLFFNAVFFTGAWLVFSRIPAFAAIDE